MQTPAFASVALLASLAACGCSSASSSNAANSDSASTSAPSSWDRQVTRPVESRAETRRVSCAFDAGSLPAETLGREIPVDVDIPLKNIVVLMQENRSFDSYFGRLGKFMGRSDIESPPDGASNPENVSDPRSPRHAWQHAPMLCMADTNHEWAGSHIQYNGGRMDGFFQTNQGYWESSPQPPDQALTGERALWYYDERDIPFYYQLASTFTVGDHYHASLLGPTYPNRDFLYAATSLGETGAHAPPAADDLSFPAHDLTIFDMLERRKISWMIYVDSFPHIPRVGALLGLGYLSRWPEPHVDVLSNFYEHAKNGTLPQVVFIDGMISEDVNGDDEHPPGDIQVGQKFVSDVVHSLFASPQWKDLALFISYDEHGGIYDHVPPPPACVPDGYAPQLSGDDARYPGAFDTLGVRVPFMVVSPYAKKSYVTHTVYDHTSLTRFIEAKFKLPALTRRDANATPPFDAFDFANPPFMTPPSIPEPQVDSLELEKCRNWFGQQTNNENGGGGN